MLTATAFFNSFRLGVNSCHLTMLFDANVVAFLEKYQYHPDRHDSRIVVIKPSFGKTNVSWDYTPEYSGMRYPGLYTKNSGYRKLWAFGKKSPESSNIPENAGKLIWFLQKKEVRDFIQKNPRSENSVYQRQTDQNDAVVITPSVKFSQINLAESTLPEFGAKLITNFHFSTFPVTPEERKKLKAKRYLNRVYSDFTKSGIPGLGVFPKYLRSTAESGKLFRLLFASEIYNLLGKIPLFIHTIDDPESISEIYDRMFDIRLKQHSGIVTRFSELFPKMFNGGVHDGGNLADNFSMLVFRDCLSLIRLLLTRHHSRNIRDHASEILPFDPPEYPVRYCQEV